MKTLLFLVLATFASVKGFKEVRPLKVFNLNTWALSNFDNYPIPSVEEPYNVSLVRNRYYEFLSENYPNPWLTPAFLGLNDTEVLYGFNPALATKERVDSVCSHIL